MADYSYLTFERSDGTLIVTMTNPPRQMLNAPMVRELHALADSLAEDEDVRVLVLTGGADGVFITHYDVGELSGVSDAARTREDIGAGPELHDMHRLLLKLQALPQPVIAAVNGTAMGGGCELALACDFRIIARGGVFGLPEVRVGILPGAGGTQRMARLLGTAKALELMLLGDTVDADEAVRIGLAHRAIDADRLLPEAKALSAELTSRPRLSLALIKQCILRGSEMPLEEGLRFEQEAFWKTMRSEDASRLMRAYLQGQRPLNEMEG
jgi:enoyl-CoA hydratase